MAIKRSIAHIHGDFDLGESDKMNINCPSCRSVAMSIVDRDKKWDTVMCPACRTSYRRRREVGAKIICVEGYKSFEGTIRVHWKNPDIPASNITGAWLYKPDTDCWYCMGSSYPADTCEIMEVG